MKVEFVNEVPFGEKVGACIILVDKFTNKIYLSRRKGEYENGKYACPGGMVEPNEDWSSAAIRETFEETGLKLKFPDVKYIATCRHEGAKSNYTVWFRAYLNDSQIPQNKEPHKHEDWILYSKSELMSLPLMLSTREIFEKIL